MGIFFVTLQRKEMDMARENGYTVLDLFCGCGGLSKGYEMAGYDVLLGVDFD